MDKTLNTELSELISDTRTKGFEYADTVDVPSANKSDANLTYESGKTKKGKKIETCVLFVDIRNSVSLIEKHQPDTMGKVYTAFTKSVLKIAENHSGKVRNIIGDRVMIVFPSHNCFINAVHCAFSINHIAMDINKQFPHVDFKCGIGVDFGEMKVIKVGIEKKGEENSDYKNLIWVGYPANRASRLTDSANKTSQEIYFIINKKYPAFNIKESRIETRTKTQELSSEEFAKLIHSSDGNLVCIEDWDNILGFEKKVRTIDFPAILISEKVFKGYQNENPTCNSLFDGHWKEIVGHIKNVKDKVYGASSYWKLN